MELHKLLLKTNNQIDRYYLRLDCFSDSSVLDKKVFGESQK